MDLAKGQFDLHNPFYTKIIYLNIYNKRILEHFNIENVQMLSGE